MKKIIHAIIPARGGSKGLPGKNIKHLGDKPLIAHTIEAARKSEWLGKVIVSTDDEIIKEISLEYGAEVPFLRPKELATDTSTSVDVLIHYIRTLQEDEKVIPEYLCLLQCTTPFRTTQDIDQAIQKCLQQEADACVSVCEVEENPYWMVTVEEERIKKLINVPNEILRRQELPKVYRYNGGVYIIKTEVLLEDKTLFPENTTPYLMSAKSSMDIDTELDFKICELIYEEIGSN